MEARGSSRLTSMALGFFRAVNVSAGTLRSIASLIAITAACTKKQTNQIKAQHIEIIDGTGCTLYRQTILQPAVTEKDSFPGEK